MDFSAPYNRKNYLDFLRNTLLPEDFREADETIRPEFKHQFIQRVIKIGHSPSLELNVYEVEHNSENDPRVSLSKESFKLLAEHGQKRALMFFTSKTPNYRFSLVTVDLSLEGKRVKREYSNPRRYSFFLGRDAKIHTPQEYLLKPGRVKDFDDLKNRFSIEVVNKDFFKQIAILFTKLTGGKREIGRETYDFGKGTLAFPSLEDTKRKEFAVRLIGRLVFCWFLNKKHLLPEELLSTNAIDKNKGYYHNTIEPLFFEVLNKTVEERAKDFTLKLWSIIPFLNGGLFTPNKEDDYYETDLPGISKYINTLKVPDDWLKELLVIFETYNFTIDENTPIDVELAIEPEMLGRIFENLLAEINPETGETARKATGSYYTPRPIVEYMVDESLKQYLINKTNLSEGKVLSLLSYSNEDTNFTVIEKDTILNALDTIKIIDPACGSGAFPMGILQKMLLILRKVDPDSNKWLSKVLSKIDDPLARRELQKRQQKGGWDYVRKLGIIRDAIYGVDIQPIAVEIAKLRCFLSLIVDETIDAIQPNHGIEPLPNLEFKFVCSNTLIGLPKHDIQHTMFENKDLINDLKRLRDEYLGSYGNDKKNIEDKFRKVQSKMFEHSLNWRGKESQTSKLSQWEPFSHESCPWFDPEWMFGIKDGFDIVIANPPYVQIKKIPWDDRKIYEKLFASAVGRFNLFYFFLELSGSLAKQSGISVFIVPDRLLLNTQCDQLRKWLLKEQTIIELDSFAEGVFEAVVDSIIILYRNIESEAKEVKVKNRVTLDNLVQSDSVNVPISYFLNSPSNQFDLSYDPLIAILLEKIKSQSVPLGKISDIKDGIIQGKVADRLFLDEPIDDDSKPLLFGEDVTKYSIRFNENWVNYKPNEMMQLEVKRRGEGVRHGLWMRTPEIFERNKILTRQTADEIIATYDTEFYYYSNTLHGSAILDTQYHPFYVLALLNSNLITWYYRSTTAEEGKVFAQIKIELLRLLPIKKETNGNQRPIISLVEKIHAITKSDDYQQNDSKQSQVQKLQNQIDQMVYELYGLTPDEIAIVESKK